MNLMYTVLVVDDDPAIREIFTAYLEMGGYTVIAVSGGQECLELLKTRIPDLILLDLMMEPMDGWETLRGIRRQPGTGQIPAMIITGKQPVPEDILQYGGLIEDFIVKPVEFSRLAASLPCTIEKVRDLDQVVSRKKAEGLDPALIAEYSSLLRLVRITYNLIGRFAGIPWAGRISLQTQEERLLLLHNRLGVPDRFLKRDNGEMIGAGR
jgi:CheY-like chemotaxis protein